MPNVYRKPSGLSNKPLICPDEQDRQLLSRGKQREEWQVKIAAGVEASLSGDFFFYPVDKLEALEASLAGVELSAVEPTIAEFYQREGIESPGVTPADFARVLTGQGVGT